MSVRNSIIIFILSFCAVQVISYVLFHPKDSQTETKVESQTDRKKIKKTVTTVVTKPDGTKEEKTTTTEKTQTQKDVNTVKNETIAETKPGVNISALIGLSLSGGVTPIYGGAVTKSFIGPTSVGVWGVTPGVFGVSLGLTF